MKTSVSPRSSLLGTKRMFSQARPRIVFLHSSSLFRSNQHIFLRRYLGSFKIHVSEATPAGFVVPKLKAQSWTHCWRQYQNCSYNLRWLVKKKTLMLKSLVQCQIVTEFAEIWQSIRALQAYVNQKGLYAMDCHVLSSPACRLLLVACSSFIQRAKNR